VATAANGVAVPASIMALVNGAAVLMTGTRYKTLLGLGAAAGGRRHPRRAGRSCGRQHESSRTLHAL
jgi:hypothetical protein